MPIVLRQLKVRGNEAIRIPRSVDVFYISWVAGGLCDVVPTFTSMSALTLQSERLNTHTYSILTHVNEEKQKWEPGGRTDGRLCSCRCMVLEGLCRLVKRRVPRI